MNFTLIPKLQGKPLTPREVECITLVANGYTASDGSKVLGIAEGTFKTHMERIIVKLEAENGPNAVYLACKEGWL